MTWGYLRRLASFSMQANSSTVTQAAAPLQLAIIILILWIEMGLPFHFGWLKHPHNNPISGVETQINLKAKIAAAEKK